MYYTYDLKMVLSFFVLYKSQVQQLYLHINRVSLNIFTTIYISNFQLSMIFLGLTSASELAYMSYAYAKICDRELYQKMTGIVRGSNLLGKCLSSTFAQIAVSYIHIEYSVLVYISLTGYIYILNL